MQEVLSRRRDCSTPVHGEEFVELFLSDLEDPEHGRIWVIEKLYQWDDLKKQVMQDTAQSRVFPTLDQAEAWYAERRRALGEMGFKYSDLDW